MKNSTGISLLTSTKDRFLLILDKEIEIEQLKQIEIESGIAKAETKTVTLINVR